MNILLVWRMSLRVTSLADVFPRDTRVSTSNHGYERDIMVVLVVVKKNISSAKIYMYDAQIGWLLLA
jgi:hypothetical protein